jgi:hypothetical protein
MSEELTIEQRLTALEKEVAQLKICLEQFVAPKKNWLEQISGSMEKYPEFGEVLRLGAEIRRADRPADDN